MKANLIRGMPGRQEFLRQPTRWITPRLKRCLDIATGNVGKYHLTKHSWHLEAPLSRGKHVHVLIASWMMVVHKGRLDVWLQSLAVTRSVRDTYFNKNGD